MYAANFVSGFARIVHVLKTTTSASSWAAASPSPSDSSMPLIRSESWAFIWQPKVVTWYRFTVSIVARRVARSSAGRTDRSTGLREGCRHPRRVVMSTLIVRIEGGGCPDEKAHTQADRDACRRVDRSLDRRLC